MRVFITLYIILVLLLTGSCQESSYTSQLHRAEELMEERPDSALKLLVELKPRLQQVENGNTHFLYGLLRVKAQDKAYIPHQTDTVITSVVAYYEKVSDRKRLPEAYYYAGRVYRDLGDAPLALNYFQKALDHLPQDEEYGLRSRIYSQMGMLHFKEEMYDKAVDAFKSAHQYSVKSDDFALIINTTRDMARAFALLNHSDSTLYYYHKAISLAQLVNKEELFVSISVEAADIYRQLGKKAKAIRLLKENIPHKKQYIAPYYANIADCFFEIGAIDSAQWYYEKLCSMGNHHHKQIAYQGLANVARRKGRHAEALEYTDKYKLYTDSIHLMKNAEVVRRVDALYNYQQREKENFYLESKNQQLMSILFILVLLGIVLVVLLKIQREKHGKTMATLKHLQEEQKTQLMTSLVEKEGSDSEVREEVSEGEVQLLSQSPEVSQESISACGNGLSGNQNDEDDKLTEKEFENTETYRKFHMALKIAKAGGKDKKASVDDADWLNLQRDLDRTYNNFTQRLEKKCPSMSIPDLRLSMLLKMKIISSDAGRFISCSRQAVHSKCLKWAEIVIGPGAKAKDWKHFITTF